MAKFIVRVTYRVETDMDETFKEMEKVEAQRWGMLQKKYEMEALELIVERRYDNDLLPL